MLGHAGLPGTAAAPVVIPDAPPLFAGGPVIGALALNVTVTDSEDPAVGGGYVTVFPCGTRPEASNLNFVAGQTIANAVIAPVSATGRICFYVYGTANLLADVSGYLPTPNTVGFTYRGSERSPDSARRPALVQPHGRPNVRLGVLRRIGRGRNCATRARAGGVLHDHWLTPAIRVGRARHTSTAAGHTSHFGVPVEGLGASFPNLTTLTIVKPDPSSC